MSGWVKVTAKEAKKTPSLIALGNQGYIPGQIKHCLHYVSGSDIVADDRWERTERGQRNPPVGKPPNHLPHNRNSIAAPHSLAKYRPTPIAAWLYLSRSKDTVTLLKTNWYRCRILSVLALAVRSPRVVLKIYSRSLRSVLEVSSRIEIYTLSIQGRY